MTRGRPEGKTAVMTGSTNGPAVRPMSGADDMEALNAGNPLRWQASLWQQLAEAGDLEMHWFTGLLDGEPVGFAAACPMAIAAGGCGVGLVTVLPEARRHGVGTALRDRVEATCRGRVPGVQYSYFEGDSVAEAVASAWGLSEVARHRESVLDLTAIDRERFRARPLPPGTEVRGLASLADLDDAGWHALHDYLAARFDEAPDADGADELPYGVFRTLVQEPWMLLTATKDGEYAAVSMVINRPGEPGAANTFFTGVSPELRGQGLAGAIKARHALVLADRGVPRLYTQNMDGNLPILAANHSLGFVTASGYVDVRQALAVDRD